MRRKLFAVTLVLLMAAALSACGSGQPAPSAQAGEYVRISQEEAKDLMDSEKDCVILDVRTREEYVEKHIPGAVLIPDNEVESRAQEELPDKEQLILVYCRSGNRSKKAAQVLADMGYTNVKEFGGINTWPYDTE